ncbi:MAG: hypothetical protein J6S29_02485 [Methanosphaera sp.]|nr:hypothetical protein [Methanosphaera sp.]
MKRKILIFLCFMLCIVSLVGVSAADEITEINDNANDVVSVYQNDVGNNLLSDNQVISSDSRSGDVDGNDVDYVNNGNLNVNESRKETKINVYDVEMYYKDGTRFSGNLTDGDGNPLAGMSLSATINGQTKNYTTDANGVFSFAINLIPGVYLVDVVFSGDSNYQPSNASSTVYIQRTLYADDIDIFYKGGSRYGVVVVHGYTPLANISLSLNINGRIYYRTTNDLGVATLAINLIPGTYIITTERLDTGERLSTNITVKSLLSENNDIYMRYKDGTGYTVKVTKPDGEVAGAGEIVTFNINGVLYNRTTNESGYARLNINLPQGLYIITADYKGCKVSNNIIVSPVITAFNLKKEYGSPDMFVASLVDSQGFYYPNQTVKFNINGVMYYRTTDEWGQAKLSINLLPGKYIITSTAPNGNSISNTIYVTDPSKINTTMDLGQTQDGVKKTFEWHHGSDGVADGFTIYPYLTDVNGNVLEKTVTLNFYDRQGMLVKTMQGISTSPISLLNGVDNDFATAFRGDLYILFEGDSQYNPSNEHNIHFGKS